MHAHLRHEVCRGVPVDRYSREETMVAYWGIGMHLGRANAQNRKGHLIGHIKVWSQTPCRYWSRVFALCQYGLGALPGVCDAMMCAVHVCATPLWWRATILCP